MNLKNRITRYWSIKQVLSTEPEIPLNQMVFDTEEIAGIEFNDEHFKVLDEYQQKLIQDAGFRDDECN